MRPEPIHASRPIRFEADEGAVTAEYAIATIAAVGFAALLVVVLRSDAVRDMLTELIRHALTVPV